MASTLTPTTFNIKITEEQVVKNNITKHEVTHTINNVTNVDHRILTCPVSTSVELIQTGGSTPGAGKFPSSSLKYVRISNLDDEFSLAITLSSSNGVFSQEITPLDTYILPSSNITSSNYSGSFGDTIESIQAYAISGSVDVEYTIVNS